MDDSSEYLNCLQRITDLFKEYCDIQRRYLQEKDSEKGDVLRDELYRIMFDHYKSSNKLKELLESLSLENPESLNEFSRSIEHLVTLLEGFDKAMNSQEI